MDTQHYLVALTPEQAEKLRSETDVNFDYVEYDDVPGALLADRELAQVLECFQATVAEQRPSSHKYIQIVVLDFENNGENVDEEGRILLSGWESDVNAYRAELCKLLLPVLADVQVVFQNRDGEIAAPCEDGRFHLHVFSSPQGNPRNSIPQKVWGECGKLFRKWLVYASSELGWTIIDDQLFEVGELVGENNAYLHLPLSEECGGDEVKLLHRFLEELVKLKELPAESRAEHLDAQRREYRELSCQRYVQKCAVTFSNREEQLKKEEEEAQAALRAAQEALTQSRRRIEDTHRELGLLEVRAEESDERLKLEFERLRNVPGVDDVYVHPDSSRIDVFTDHIEILYSGDEDKPPEEQRIYMIGRFRIELYPDAEEANDRVRFFNLTRIGTRRYDGSTYKMQHPHVEKNGKACLGNIAKDLPEAIARYEFSESIVLCLKFLEQANITDRWGAWVENWPLKPKEGAVQNAK